MNPTDQTCTWVFDGNDPCWSNWSTECEKEFQFYDQDVHPIKDLEMVYCPYCGRKLVIKNDEQK